MLRGFSLVWVSAAILHPDPDLTLAQALALALVKPNIRCQE